GDISQLTAAAPAASSAPATAPAGGLILEAMKMETVLILEAMKMETEIRAAQAGTVRGIAVKSGDAVSVGDTLMTLA
ncbi:Oxaloacetate decarboxylase alpha chain, partial [Salmonella enterica subsp. enterica serovar Mississippi str. A4-633]